MFRQWHRAISASSLPPLNGLCIHWRMLDILSASESSVCLWLAYYTLAGVPGI